MVLKKRTIKKIFELRNKGLSIRKIAKKLGISPTSVSEYIKRGYMEKKAGSKKVRPVTRGKKKVLDDDFLEMPELLDKIISEVTNRHGRAAVIRMVQPYINDPNCRDYGLRKLAEALTLANFSPGDKQLILINWALFVWNI